MGKELDLSEFGGGNQLDLAEFSKPPTSTASRVMSDLGKSLKSGVEQLPGQLAGLADLAPALTMGARPFTNAANALGDMTGFTPGKWAKDIEYSPEAQASQAEIDKAWEDPNTRAADVAGAYLRNPAYIANQVAQSVPGMVAGGVASRMVMGAGAVAPMVEKGIAAVPGYLERVVGSKMAAPIAGGIGEGAQQTGQQMDQDADLPDQRKNAVAALASGVIGAGIGAGMGRAANALGFETAQTLMAKGLHYDAAGKPLKAAARIAGGAVDEAAQEVLQSGQEQAWQNYAEDKPLGEGVARQAIEGGLAGGVMGAAANVAHGGQPAAPAPAIDPNAGPISKAASLLALPAAVTPVNNWEVVNDQPQPQAALPAPPAAEVPLLPAPDEQQAIMVDSAGNAAPMPNTVRTDSQNRTVEADLATERAAGVQPDDIQGPQGRPFKTRIAAMAEAKRAGPGFEPAAVTGGGFVARRAPDASERQGNGRGTAGERQDGESITVSAQLSPTPTEIDTAAHAAATSPQNDLPEPTDDQKEAGNYQKGHVQLHGLDITVENPRGSERAGKRPDGSQWAHTMSDHYGYIKRTVGADEEQVDVYLGPDAHHDQHQVYVIDQLHQDTGKFDEHKAMLGYPDEASAVQAYKSNFDAGWKVGPVTPMPIGTFKEWLKNGDTKSEAAKAAQTPAPDQGPAVGGQAPGSDATGNVLPVDHVAPIQLTPALSNDQNPAPAAPAAAAKATADQAPAPVGIAPAAAGPAVSPETGSGPLEAAGVKPLTLGMLPNTAEPVTVQNGVVHIGKGEALNYDTGEPIKVAAGATDAQIKKALQDGGAVSRRQKFYGGEKEDAETPVIPVIPVIPASSGQISETQAEAQKGPENGLKSQETGSLSADSGKTTAPVSGAARPSTWRTNFIAAAKVARDLGIDPKGKKLAGLVAEIDAKDGTVHGPARPARASTTTEAVYKFEQHEAIPASWNTLNDYGDSISDPKRGATLEQLRDLKGQTEKALESAQAAIDAAKGGAKLNPSALRDYQKRATETYPARLAILNRMIGEAEAAAAEVAPAQPVAKTAAAPEDQPTPPSAESATSGTAEPALIVKNVIQDGKAAAALANEQAKTAAEQAKAQERNTQRALFTDLTNNPAMVGKSIEEIAGVLAAKLHADGLSLSGLKAVQLARAIHKTVAKNAKELAKQQHRHPGVRAAALTEAVSSSYPDAGAVTVEQHGQFIAGFDHAMAGKTKSTLLGDHLADQLKGYEAALDWRKTEEGAAWFEGRPVNKLTNTGVDLRRHWEQLQAEMKAGESDMKKAWAQIERATNRADLFAPLLPEGVSPGFTLYATDARAGMITFKDWLQKRHTTWYGSTYYKSRYSDDKGSNMERILLGTRYPGHLDKTDRAKFESDEGYRADYLRLAAAEYLDRAKKFIAFLEGKSSVKEAAEAFDAAYINVAERDSENNKRYPSVYKLFNDSAHKLTGSGKDAMWDGHDGRLLNLQSKSDRTLSLIDQEATIALPTKADALTPPKLDRVTREGMPDQRKGKDVTPAEFKATFGFADVGFGKWVGSKQDQDHLNYAYDAFMDLANHFGMPPKNVGLGGALHFTIGALGRGKASAHFWASQPHPEGGTVSVINLTNTRGDGTVYHEWTHALDHFLGGEWGAVRKKLLQVLSRSTPTPAFFEERARSFLFGSMVWTRLRKLSKVAAAVRGMEYYEHRSGPTAYKANADKLGKDYWGNEAELIARAAEAWAVDTLKGTNTYLVNPGWAGDGAATPEKGYRGTPYPTGAERELFAKVYTALSKAVTWKDGKPTVSLQAFEAAMPDLSAGERRRQDLLKPENMQAYYDQLMQDKADAKQAEQDALDALAEQQIAELAPTVVDGPTPAEVTGPLTDDDLGAIFDQAAAELREEAQEQPDAPAPGEGPKNLTQTERDKLASGRYTPKDIADARASEQTDKSAADLIAEAAKMGVKGADEALKGLSALFGKPGRLNSFPGGFDEETYQQAKPHFEAALQAFQAAGKSLKDLFKLLIQQFGEGMKEYAVRFAKDQNLTARLGAQPSASSAVADKVVARLKMGHAFDWRVLFGWADEAFGGTQGEGKYTPKDAYDALEMGVNRYLAADQGRAFNPNVDRESALVSVAALDRVLALIPTQSKRTAEQDAFQQFSTVPTLAFVANWAANITSGDVMMEPSAGLGGLTVFAKNAGAQLILNELSSRRAALLQELFPGTKVWTENAEQIHNILPAEAVPSVVVMNPPFSASAGRMQGVNNTKVGAQHVEQALARLAPGGRLVAIVGEGMTMDKPTFKAWWAKIQGKFDVRAVIPMDGSGYAKYGTTFDNAILVIDKIPPSGREVVTTKATTYNELVGLLSEIRDERPNAKIPSDSRPGAELDAAESERDRPDAGVASGVVAGETGDPAAAGVGTGEPGSGSAVGAGGGQGGKSGGSRRPGSGVSKPGRTGDRAGNEPGTGGQGNPDLGGGSDSGANSTGVTVTGADQVAAPGALTDSVFEGYTPQRLQIAGAKPHPGALVQSSAMASVLPPAVTYTPNLPAKTIKEGMLSLAQLEAVVYAGQAHEQDLELRTSPELMLALGLDKAGVKLGELYRRGFFIGDGTGVGKGREIGGIILDNIRQGRKKHVWVSEKQGLLKDAKRDFGGVGGDKDLLFNQNKTASEGTINAKDGVIFTTYATLRSGSNQAPAGSLNAAGQTITRKQTRLDQLVKWLGADFDGVIAFDEAHNAGNALAIKGERGTSAVSAQAEAVVELQNRLPRARIVYVSATGATEVSNLSFANRLGLWGPGTPFAAVANFIAEMTAGGLATMELVARDMKQMGAYIARSLSFDGVTYSRLEHELTEIQHDQYNKMAEAWQITLRNMEKALETTGAAGEDGAKKKNDAKKNMKSAYWGAQQRFFNQIITSMQMPTALDSIERDIANGDAVVLQLVNTNEASQERALAKRKEEGESTDLEDLDMTPRDQLLQMVAKSFPVQQYEDFVDSEGKKGSRVVKDSEGNPVENREAVAMREKLLQDLREIKVPDGPLEILINHFGPEITAEVTGRKQRVVSGRWNREHKGGGDAPSYIDKRSASSAQADADAFMDDKKRLLVFSDAGGTGFSFQADLTKANQRPRKHYLIQPGWRANKAVQGLGRTHRTNQKSAPHYTLVSTDIPAHKRFLSSIARRLDQLGALTKGQRDTSSGGLFTEKDNLESTYAQQASKQLILDIQHGQVEGLVFNEFMRQMGLEDIINPDTHQIAEDKFPKTSQFLNRLLSLSIPMQHKVFDAFIARMEEKVEVAASRGELDTGMQTIRAIETKILSEETVYTDPRTKAETSLIELEAKQPNRFYTFPSEKTQGAKIRWVTNNKSGRVWGVVKSGTITHRDGSVVDKYRALGTGGTQVKEATDFKKDAWKDVTETQARALWEAENAVRPPTYVEKIHLISGAMLPIWDRLKTDGRIQVARTQTSDGRRLLGRVLNPKDVPDIRKRLDLTSEVSKLAPAQIMARILKGETGQLANGWSLVRAKVSDDLRIELKAGYLSNAASSELTNMGVMKERISWNERYFIPTGADGVPVLAALFKNKPIIDLIDPNAKAASDEDDDAQAFKTRGAAGAGMERTAIDKAVSEITRDWLRKPQLEILDSMDDAPPKVRAEWLRQGGDDVVHGFHLKGTVYIVADAMNNAADVAEVLFHESLGHFGLRGFFGSALDEVREEVADKWKLRVTAKARGYGLDMNKRADRLLAAEEVLAEMAATRPELPIVRRLIAVIRTWLREHVAAFKDLALTDAEIIHRFILPARGFVERGTSGRATFTTSPTFSKKELSEADRKLAAMFAGPDSGFLERGKKEPVASRKSLRAELKKNGQQVASSIDAERLFSDGWRIYGFHELDEGGTPTLLDTLGKLQGYTADQMLALPPAPDTGVAQFSRGHLGELNAAQERALKAVGALKQPKTLAQRFGELRANLGTRLAQGLFDQFAPIKDLDPKAYIMARLSKGSEGTMEAALLYGKPFLRDGAPDVNMADGGFAKVLAALKGEHDRFLWWVAAQRAELLKKPTAKFPKGRENLFTDADISDLKTLADGNMADGTSRTQAFETALRGLNEYNEAVLQMALDSSLIDQEAFDLFKDQPYVPFYRVMEDEMTGPRFSSGLTNQKAYKQLKGGTSQLNDDLLQNMLQNWSHLYTAAARNRAALATMDAAENLAIAYEINPHAGSTKKAVKVMRGGVAEHWQIEDPYLLEAVTALNYTPSPLMKPLAKMKQVMTFGVTVNPAFKVRNLLRDSIASMGLADMSYNPLKNVAQGWKTSGMHSQVYASMLASGGVMKFGTQENSDRMRHKIAKLGGTMLNDGKWASLTETMGELWDAYQELGDRSENVNRTALYEQLIAKGKTHAEASFMARDLMDFTMSGRYAVVRFLIQTVPFLNARLQGMYKLGRAAKEDPKRFAVIAGAVSLASLALMAGYHDDEDWKKREDWDRDSYWWFKIGDTAFRIPRPFEIGAIGTLAERTAELMFSKEMTGQRFGDRLSFMVNQTFALNPVPQAFSPLFDVYANRDAFRRQPIESMHDKSLQPQDRHDERTSEIARFLGMLGLPEPLALTKGEYNELSPKQWDFLLRGYFSWIGASTASLTDYAIRPMLDRGDRPDNKIRGGFVEPLPSGGSRYVSVFYEQARETQEAFSSYRAALKEGNTDRVAQLVGEGRVQNHIQVGRIRQRLDELNALAKRIEGNRMMSGEVKRSKLDEIDAKRNEIATSYALRKNP